MLILVFTRMLCSKNLTRWHWPMTLKINRVPDSPKDYVCTKFGQILVNTRINILQWILTKLGTYLDLKRIWNPVDFQGQRSRSQGLIFRRGDMPRFALPRWHWPMTLKINRVPDSPKDYVCTTIGENPLKDVDSKVFTRKLCGKNLTPWLSPNILVNTLESTFFNGFSPKLVHR
jgi:hypothetical protein